MRRQLVSSFLAVVLFTLLAGLAYPLAMTGVSQVVFPSAANGSLLYLHGRVVGSALIGQSFLGSRGQPLPQYFQPRPSASSYDALASGGSNLGPSSPSLATSERQLAGAYRAFNQVPSSTLIPSDAVTSSGSGLDPDISIANADLQAPRVARTRGLALSTVLELIHSHTTPVVLGSLGEPVVNVLELNLALDRRT